jgi:hypothetical protein
MLYVILCYYMLLYVIICYYMLLYVIICYIHIIAYKDRTIIVKKNYLMDSLFLIIESSFLLSNIKIE